MQQAARDGTIELLYFDEAGFSCLPHVQRSGSALGQAHEADASVGRKRANVLGALNYAAQTLEFRVCEHSVCRSNIIDFLHQLACASDPEKNTFIVMDNASIHHGIEPQTLHHWLLAHRFIPVYLPPYSPELNCIEILWKHAKYHWRGFTSWARDALVHEVTDLLNGFGTKFHIRYA